MYSKSTTCSTCLTSTSQKGFRGQQRFGSQVIPKRAIIFAAAGRFENKKCIYLYKFTINLMKKKLFVLAENL